MQNTIACVVGRKIKYSPIKNQLNSFNTDKTSIRKSKKVSCSLKRAKLTPNLPINTTEIRREFSFVNETYIFGHFLSDLLSVLNEFN